MAAFIPWSCNACCFLEVALSLVRSADKMNHHNCTSHSLTFFSFFYWYRWVGWGGGKLPWQFKVIVCCVCMSVFPKSRRQKWETVEKYDQCLPVMCVWNPRRLSKSLARKRRFRNHGNGRSSHAEGGSEPRRWGSYWFFDGHCRSFMRNTNWSLAPGCGNVTLTVMTAVTPVTWGHICLSGLLPHVNYKRNRDHEGVHVRCRTAFKCRRKDILLEKSAHFLYHHACCPQKHIIAAKCTAVLHSVISPATGVHQPLSLTWGMGGGSNHQLCRHCDLRLLTVKSVSPGLSKPQQRHPIVNSEALSL